MINELLKGRFICPVCGRILYFPLKGYWCPFCGTDIKTPDKTEQLDLADRITARDENGVPYYCGRYTFNTKTYIQDIKLTALAEILEKLCQYEEIEEVHNGD